jgi:hypothetical protein
VSIHHGIELASSTRNVRKLRRAYSGADCSARVRWPMSSRQLAPSTQAGRTIPGRQPICGEELGRQAERPQHVTLPTCSSEGHPDAACRSWHRRRRRLVVIRGGLGREGLSRRRRWGRRGASGCLVVVDQARMPRSKSASLRVDALSQGWYSGAVRFGWSGLHFERPMRTQAHSRGHPWTAEGARPLNRPRSRWHFS